MQLCVEYLSEHKGQVHFSLGARATEMVREVNNLVFDVAMNMIFESIEDYLNYQHDPRHLEFITMSAGMSSTRSVFDSYIEDELPVKVAAKKASSTKHK